jgi:hypothetical protein
MNGWQGKGAIVTLLAGSLAAGCGGGGVDKSNQRVPDLARPIYPTCRVPGFVKPKVQQVPSPSGKGGGWQLSFLPPPLTVRHPGVTTNVLIVERVASAPAAGVKGGHTTTIAGRKVSLRAPNAKASVFVAQWKTNRAVYIALANGNKPDTLERFIACFP